MAGFYSSPQSYSPYFAGGRRQNGGGIFGSLARALLPKVKDFGKAAAKRAFNTAINVANDVVSGKSVGRSLKSRGENFLHQTFNDGISRITNNNKRPAVVLGTTASSLPPKRLRTSFKQKTKKKKKSQQGKGLF